MDSTHYIFVCGAGHSGTTLMLALLDAHHGISAVPRETNIFRNRDESDESKLKRIAGWPAKFRLKPARYIAEKTPIHSRRLDDIFRLIPAAKIVLVIRDGRDSTISFAKRIGTYEEAVKTWMKYTTDALRFRDHLHVVHYEDLVGRTEETLRALCDYLLLPFDQAMLEHNATERNWFVTNMDDTSVGRHRRNRREQINRAIFDDSGKWREEMTNEQKETFKKIGGPLLISLGYAKDMSW